MSGPLKLAYKLLVNDKSKFTALLVGIAFAVFLMTFVTSMLFGILNHASSMVYNVGASVWVMDPAVNNVASSIGMPDYVLDAVRSMPGVKYAVPLYSGTALVKLADGTYQPATVIGLDDTTLFGRPQLTAGRIEDIYAENGFIVVNDADYPKLGSPKIGAEFELNDHRGVIVGIAKVPLFSLFGIPTLYTTYYRALQYVPNPRFTISYVLVEPKSPAAVPEIESRVASLGYLALTRTQFARRISDFYMFQTGVGTNIVIMTLISFVVGLSISGQTFYTFIAENLERFGALKAIGATNGELVRMIVFQSVFTALTGYGLGTGLATLLIFIARLHLPNYAAMIAFTNLGLAFSMVVVIAAFSAYIGVRRVLRIEPFEIFRG